MKYTEIIYGLKVFDDIIAKTTFGSILNNPDIRIMNFQDGCNGKRKQRIEAKFQFSDGHIVEVLYTPGDSEKPWEQL